MLPHARFPRVKREGRRWYVILTAEQTAPESLPANGSVVGIDMGVANFLADSNGEFVENPRHGARGAAKLKAAQQGLSRCKRGSKRRRKAVETVARLHRKVRRQRLDHLDHAHKTALEYVRGNGFIAHEDLKIRNMSKTPTPKPDPEQPGSSLPNGAAAKAGLNRSIADAGWGGCSSHAGTPPRRTGPHRRSSAASRATTKRTRTPWAP